MVNSVAITGGAGYVGSALVPYLIRHEMKVTVLDTFWYSKEPFHKSVLAHPNLRIVKGDIRDVKKLDEAFAGCDAVIHLACVSNDPSFELNPKLGREINLDAFPPILAAVKRAKIKRFIYASSSSVYGVKDKDQVVETDSCEPLTDYSKYKLECEKMLQDADMEDVKWTIVRPATVCGFAKRMRFDLVVNLLTAQALIDRRIKVFGGSQLRPNLNVNDMVRAYDMLLRVPEKKIHGEIFNIGFENMSVLNIAKLITQEFKFLDILVDVGISADNRSYHVSSYKAFFDLNFSPIYSISDAIQGIAAAHFHGQFKDPLNNPEYFNISTMNAMAMKERYGAG